MPCAPCWPAFFSVLAGACQFCTTWAGLRLIHHHVVYPANTNTNTRVEPDPHNNTRVVPVQCHTRSTRIGTTTTTKATSTTPIVHEPLNVVCMSPHPKHPARTDIPTSSIHHHTARPWHTQTRQHDTQISRAPRATIPSAHNHQSPPPQ